MIRKIDCPIHGWTDTTATGQCVRCVEITPRMADVLEIMRGGGQWTVAQMGEQIGAKESHTHSLMLRLLHAGLIVRKRDGWMEPWKWEAVE